MKKILKKISAFKLKVFKSFDNGAIASAQAISNLLQFMFGKNNFFIARFLCFLSFIFYIIAHKLANTSPSPYVWIFFMLLLSTSKVYCHYEQEEKCLGNKNFVNKLVITGFKQRQFMLNILPLVIIGGMTLLEKTIAITFILAIILEIAEMYFAACTPLPPEEEREMNFCHDNT